MQRHPPSGDVFALDRSFVMQTILQAFEIEAGPLCTEIGVRDPVLSNVMDLLMQELREDGAGGRLYAESLGTAASVRLFRRYSDNAARRATRMRGGLATHHLKRVVDYIEANLASDISLPDLARIVNLSTHHFGQTRSQESFLGTSGLWRYAR